MTDTTNEQPRDAADDVEPLMPDEPRFVVVTQRVRRFRTMQEAYAYLYAQPIDEQQGALGSTSTTTTTKRTP